MYVLGRWLGRASLLVALHLVLINGIEMSRSELKSHLEFLKLIAFLELPDHNFIFHVYLTQSGYERLNL